MGNWTVMIWEADMLRMQREKLAKTLSQIEKSKKNKRTKRQEKATERNLLFMIALGVVCQAMGHTGYGWCVSLLTLLAMGVQGQEVNEPWTLVLETPEAEVGVRKVVSLEAPGSQTRKGQQHTTKVKQATTPADDSRCENNQPHKEELDRSILVMKKAELSLLFLTAAGVVCRLGGDHEWYGFCILSLALLA